MIEVLRNKNQTTRFQILGEIADKGPDIQQREIAKELISLTGSSKNSATDKRRNAARWGVPVIVSPAKASTG